MKPLDKKTILRSLVVTLAFLAMAVSGFASTNTLFCDNFPGPDMNPLWAASLPNVPVAKGDFYNENYLGVPTYDFETVGAVPVLRMNTSMSNLQRVGWSLNTNFSSTNFHYEVRLNTLTQSDGSSVDAFVEVWILNVTNNYYYDVVSLFGAAYGADPRFDAGSSISGLRSDQSYAYQDNTFYRLVLAVGTNQNIRASLCDDSGNELIGYDLGHTAAAYASGYTIGLSQAIDRPNVASPTDVAIASARLIYVPIPPRAATGVATNSFGFITGIKITDGGYGYTNVPSIKLIGGGGSGAQLTAIVSNGVVVGVNVNSAGSGYTNTPLVVFSPPFVPNPTLNIVPISALRFSNLTIGSSYQLQHATAWYWTNLFASFTASNTVYQPLTAGSDSIGNYRLALNPVPAQAFATAQTVNGFVVHATVTSVGSGYTSSPAIAIVGGGGSGATATVQLTNGAVSGITITGAGIGYTNVPTIQIAPPPVSAILPTAVPALRLDSANLAAYQNYQIQFTSNISATWSNYSGGLFSPTGATNSQFLFVTNNQVFFRLQYVP